MSGDLGNAFFHGRTREKVWTTLGQEWGDQEGQRAIVVKAIYGLVSSAYEFHRYVSEAMRKMGWQPVEGEPDIWIRSNETDRLYDRVAFYVDDIIVAGENTDKIVDEMKKHFSFKFTGEPERYLGSDIIVRKGMTLFASTSYIEEVLDKVERGAEAGDTCLTRASTRGEALRRVKVEDTARARRQAKGDVKEGKARKSPNSWRSRGPFNLRHHKTPMATYYDGDELEGEVAKFLKLEEIRLYRSYMGMLVWIVQLG